VRAAALEALCAMATWSDTSSPELAGALLAALAVDRFDPHTQMFEAYEEFFECRKAADALAKLDRAARERAFAQLAGDLRGLGSPRSYEAAALLLRLPDGRSTLVSSLLDSVRDGDDLSRRIAMMILWPIAEPAEAPAVLRAITSPGAERKIRPKLIWCESVHRGLMLGMAESDWSLIELGVRALKGMGVSAEHRSIHDLIAMVREPDGDLDRRRCAIIALSEFGPAAAVAVPSLIAHLDGADAPTHQEIEAALEHIVPRSPGATIAGSIAAMKAGDPVGSSRAAYELGVLIKEPPHPADAVAALLEAIGDPDPLVRQFAAAVLGRLAPTAPAAGPALFRAARDPDESVRRLAAWGLSRVRR
jgi:HEAT repeat protein